MKTLTCTLAMILVSLSAYAGKAAPGAESLAWSHTDFCSAPESAYQVIVFGDGCGKKE